MIILHFQKSSCLISGVNVLNDERETTILPKSKLELKTINVTLFCGLVVFGRARLEVSNGKPVNTKLSISSGVNLLQSCCSTTYNADHKHVSTLNLE